MIKIQSNKSGPDISLNKKLTKEGNSKGVSFAHVLEQTIEPTKVNAATGIVATQPVDDSKHSIREQAMSIGEQTLDLLARCQSMVDQPDSSSRLNTLAETIKNQVTDLQTVRDNLPHDDPLRAGIERIGILGTVESMKIIRGDYN